MKKHGYSAVKGGKTQELLLLHNHILLVSLYLKLYNNSRLNQTINISSSNFLVATLKFLTTTSCFHLGRDENQSLLQLEVKERKKEREKNQLSFEGCLIRG